MEDVVSQLPDIEPQSDLIPTDRRDEIELEVTHNEPTHSNDERDPETEEVLDDAGWSTYKVYKNLFGVSVSFFLVFGPYRAQTVLQSSFNESSALGLASLSVLYFSFSIFCFFSAAVISLLGTKYTIVIAYCGLTTYTISNFYSSWFTLIPGSIAAGMIFGPLWASHSVHIFSIARLHAFQSKKKLEHIVFRFFGIYVFIFKLSNVLGNIISSSVLINDRSSNASFFGDSSDICNNTDAANSDIVYRYVLLSIYFVLDIIAIAMVIVFIDRLDNTRAMFTCSSGIFVMQIKTAFISTLKLMLNWKMIVIVMIMMLDGYTLSFMTGLFSKVYQLTLCNLQTFHFCLIPQVYISDCIGVYWIGFTTAAFGSASAVSAIVNGYLAKVIPHYLLVYAGALVNTGALIFSLIWERQPVYYIIIIIALCVGYSEGLWSSVPPSKYVGMH